VCVGSCSANKEIVPVEKGEDGASCITVTVARRHGLGKAGTPPAALRWMLPPCIRVLNYFPIYTYTPHMDTWFIKHACMLYYMHFISN
jgi:hypothetical protein